MTVSHFRGGVTRYFRTARSSTAMSTGLDRCSSIPASLLFSMSSVKAFAVMARMGIVLPSGFLPLRMGAQILIGSWTPLDTEAPALPDAEPPPQAVRAADAASRPCNAFATQRKPRRPAAFAAYRRDLYRIAKYRSAQAGPHCPPTMLPPRKGPVSRGRLLQADVQNKLPVPRLTVPGQSSKASSAISVSSDKTAMFCRE